MRNDKWQMHRVGLINFWYYDEEEYYFLDGRMLLRGANGSGKSVTMQSLIPLLLDGNMRPERLDPFGSRARKMENYLLEEGDERDERTGYLYLECRRRETDQYVTIGIGLRARKNKKLESWYFCITDGRRIGKDFFLYRDVHNKIPFSRTELRNRLEEGGKVMDTQSEYVSCVNRLLFGFDTIEEYKELLELLIQLRTPKLSKDFKPSVINDILSNSLQTLSEEDLRPMSEAIENMDNMRTSLDSLKDSIGAADQIARTYEQYVRAVLYDKAEAYLEAGKECGRYEKMAGELTRQLEESEAALTGERENYTALTREQEVLQEEKDSLSQSDAARLKDEEQRILGEIGDCGDQLEEKERQESRKSENRLDMEEKRKGQQEKNEREWDQVLCSLEEMEDLMEDSPFDDSGFLVQELRERRDEEYSFAAHEQLFQAHRDRVEEGIRILEKEKYVRDAYDRALQELDEAKAARDAAERECGQYAELLHETKSELLERIYRWEKENKELHVPSEELQEIARWIESYRYGDDYSEIIQSVRNRHNCIEDDLRDQKSGIIRQCQPLKEELEQLRIEIGEWESAREPEPERTPEVLRNREKLRELEIPFLEFYRTVDFKDELTDGERGQLEEALLQMGLLDALIVPGEYRDPVMALDAGHCDKYIFSDAVPARGGSLADLLDVENGQEDIWRYMQVSVALSAIGLERGSEGMTGTWTDRQGRYQIGLLEGNTSRTYAARFIGTASRERYKEERLRELRQRQGELEDSLGKLEAELRERENRLCTLKEEFSAFPRDADLKTAGKQLDEKEKNLSDMLSALRRKEEESERKRAEWEDVSLQAQEICAKAYLPHRLEAFQKEMENLRQYDRLLSDVKRGHGAYLNGARMLEGFEESLQELDQDLDDIRYEIGRITAAKRKQEAKLLSVREQLALTDYEQIRDRLDYCVKRLGELQNEIVVSARRETNLEDKIEQLRGDRQTNEEFFARERMRKKQLEEVFDSEYRLSVEDVSIRPEESGEKLPEERARDVQRMLRGMTGEKSQEDLYGKVQEVFHQYKVHLTEYQITLQTDFEELSEAYSELGVRISRLDIRAKYRGASISFRELRQKLEADREERERLLSDKDRELFEDILANTISKKIRARIHASRRWVENMNALMESMQTSSGLRLSLRWRSKRAEKEGQLDTNALVELLQKDAEIMREEDIEKLSGHFRSKINEVRRQAEEGAGYQSFHGIMREILDYRQWFEFQLECQKTGEKKKELTDRVFFTFSGGEKAMAMYVPLFSAVVAKYSGARDDAPRMISLDEAFAGVDEMNIKDMFRLMVEFEFNFIINSQILWGDYETVPSLAIYELFRPENAKYVTVFPFVWNGKVRKIAKSIGDEIEL